MKSAARIKPTSTETGPFKLIDEAVNLIKFAPSLLLPYYIGSLPFVLGLLYFIEDMSRSAFAADYCSAASLGMALLFVWMKTWQSVYSNSIHRRLRRAVENPGVFKRFRTAVNQTIVQVGGIVILPVSALFCIPFAWCYAFYQNVGALDDGSKDGVRSLIRESIRQSKTNPRQNHLLIFIFGVFCVFVFLNIAVTIFMLPQLLKKFFGAETMFTMSGFNIFNTTFWAVAVSLTYLLADPLIKTVYALRCFYGVSIETGEDLEAELERVQRASKQAVPVLAALLILAAVSAPEAAANHAAASEKSVRISPDALDRSIEHVIGRKEYAWRIPRDQVKKPDEPSSFGVTLIRWAGGIVKKTVRFIGNIVDSINNWMKDLFPERAPPNKNGSGVNWATSVNTLLYLLAGVFLIALLFLVIKEMRQKKDENVSAAVYAESRRPDLSDENVAADVLPADGWFALAKELLESGSYRFAVRALYLGAIAYLADNRLIISADYKSNREYTAELKRRAHGREPLIDLFVSQVNFFEKAWYGEYEVSRTDALMFEENHRRLTEMVSESA